MSVSDFENLRSRYLQCLPSVQHRVFNEGKVIRDKKNTLLKLFAMPAEQRCRSGKGPKRLDFHCRI